MRPQTCGFLISFPLKSNQRTEYKREAQDAQNPDVKTYASQTLPTLEKHLQSAKDLEKKKPATKSGTM